MSRFNPAPRHLSALSRAGGTRSNAKVHYTERRTVPRRTPMPHDRNGHPLHIGDIVRVNARGRPMGVIEEFYTDIKNGLRLDRAAGGWFSWNGIHVEHVSSPQRLAEVLTS